MAGAADIAEAERANPGAQRPLVRLLWMAAALGALVALYGLLGAYVAPGVVRSEVLKAISRTYHRTANLREVRIEPFALTLEARGFELPDADGRPMVGFEWLRVRLSLASLWRGGLAFREISLDSPRLRPIVRPDGRLNLADLALQQKSPERPLKVMIDHLQVRRGQILAEDLDRPTPLTEVFSSVNFTLDDFTTVRDGAAYVLTARTPRGEQLAWRGTAGVAPIASDGAVQLTGVQIAPLWAAAGVQAPFSIPGGRFDLDGRYRFRLDHGRLALTVDLSQVRISDAGLRPRGEARDRISLPLVTIADAHIDVPGRVIRVGGLDIDSPAVTAGLDAHGALDLARLLPATPGRMAGKTAPPEPAWSFALGQLRILRGRLAFTDLSAGQPVRVGADPIDVVVRGLAWPLAQPLAVDASAALDDGGRLAASGTIGLSPLSASLDVSARRIGLKRLQPYLSRTMSLDLVSGSASARGRVSWSPRAGARFDGAAEVDDLRTTDTILGQDFVDWRALRLEGAHLQTSPLAVKIREVTAEAPYARLVVGPNYVMNVKTVLTTRAGETPPPPTPAPGGPASAAAPATPRPAIEIGRVLVQDGRMDFSDLTVQPHFAAGVQKLNGAVTGLSSRQDARAEVALKGEVDPYSPVTIEGKVNYFAIRNFTDMRMAFQNIEMTTFTPYSGKFAGYRIAKGKLNVELRYRIDDQKLDAMHHVVINQLQLGEKVDSSVATHLPVKLIVALLKDRRGVIDLPIEITGSLDDPKFRVWPLIWKMVGNLFEKVATAPFSLLGKLVGGGEELSYIDFPAGQSGLDVAARGKLATLSKALAERPEVNLNIPVVVAPQVDRPALIESRFAAQLGAAAAEKLGRRNSGPAAVDAALKAPRSRRQILELLYQKAFGSRPHIPRPERTAAGEKPNADRAADDWLETRLRERIEVGDQDLRTLGEARARAVQDAVLGGGAIDASRVFIINEPPHDEPRVRMTLSLG